MPKQRVCSEKNLWRYNIGPSNPVISRRKSMPVPESLRPLSTRSSTPQLAELPLASIAGCAPEPVASALAEVDHQHMTLIERWFGLKAAQSRILGWLLLGFVIFATLIPGLLAVFSVIPLGSNVTASVILFSSAGMLSALLLFMLGVLIYLLFTGDDYLRTKSVCLLCFLSLIVAAASLFISFAVMGYCPLIPALGFIGTAILFGMVGLAVSLIGLVYVVGVITGFGRGYGVSAFFLLLSALTCLVVCFCVFGVIPGGNSLFLITLVLGLAVFPALSLINKLIDFVLAVPSVYHYCFSAEAGVLGQCYQQLRDTSRFIYSVSVIAVVGAIALLAAFGIIPSISLLGLLASSALYSGLAFCLIEFIWRVFVTQNDPESVLLQGERLFPASLADVEQEEISHLSFEPSACDLREIVLSC